MTEDSPYARAFKERVILSRILRKHRVRSRAAPGVSKRRLRRWVTRRVP